MVGQWARHTPLQKGSGALVQAFEPHGHTGRPWTQMWASDAKSPLLCATRSKHHLCLSSL